MRAADTRAFLVVFLILLLWSSLIFYRIAPSQGRWIRIQRWVQFLLVPGFAWLVVAFAGTKSGSGKKRARDSVTGAAGLFRR